MQYLSIRSLSFLACFHTCLLHPRPRYAFNDSTPGQSPVHFVGYKTHIQPVHTYRIYILAHTVFCCLFFSVSVLDTMHNIPDTCC
ncbi:hypothetical protein FB45DRAFT_905550, partial [Roridomyces roridus]